MLNIAMGETFQYILVGSLIAAILFHIGISIYISHRRNKEINQRIIENAALLMNKINNKTRRYIKMDKDLKKAVKYLASKVEEAKDEIIEALEEQQDQPDDFEEESNDFEEKEEDTEEEDFSDYEGERKIKTEEEEKPKKKGLFGKKKGGSKS